MKVVESLGSELEEIDQEYAKEFAGQERLTRDLGVLDRLIKRTQSLLERVDRIPSAAQGPELVRVRDAVAQSLEMYEQERKAIARAQEAGPLYQHFALEATNANLVFARYQRHFAGKDRATRDLALLGELVEDLKQIDKRMSKLLEEQNTADFARDRDVVRDSLTAYQKEIELIEKIHNDPSAEQRAMALAGFANAQFRVYETHFAGEPRVSRRPALLMRVVTTLKKIREGMLKVREEGLDVEFNDRNLSIVENRLQAYEEELAEVRKVRQATSMTAIMGELGNAANKLFDEYRANFADKPRNKADADRLANICDKLYEVRRQMMELSLAEENEMNEKNLDVVTQQLLLFESEYDAVLRARAKEPQPPK